MILGNASSLQPNQYQEKLTGKHGSPAEAYLKLISNWISLKAFTGIFEQPENFNRSFHTIEIQIFPLTTQCCQWLGTIEGILLCKTPRESSFFMWGTCSTGKI
jgi:hypothetical protein